jgi:serine/threonine-protein kinase
MSRGSGLPLLGVLAAAAIAFVFVTSAGLPDVLATHFNARGEPNAFMSRDGYRLFMAFMIVFVPFMIAGLPRLVGRHWPRLLNIPNREYWIAPERLSQALDSVYRLTTWPAAAAIALMAFVHRLVMDAHATDPPQLDSRHLLIGLALFGAFTVAWMAAFYVRFRRPPPPS